MDVIRGYEAARGRGPFILGIGTFDGVHVGHRKLLDRVVGWSRRDNLAAAAFTFDPHPMVLLGKDKAPPLICSLKRRLELIERCGIDLVIIQELHDEFRSFDPEEYIRAVLLSLPASGVVVGRGFTFGRQRQGTAADLAQLGPTMGLAVEQFPTVMSEGAPVSSSRIRQLIQDRHLDSASNMLERAFSQEGTVVRGRGRGHGLGFPTANIEAPGLLFPGTGIYAGQAKLNNDRVFPAAIHIGPPATFGELRSTIEAFLLDYADEDIYGQEIELTFFSFLRPVQHFGSEDELKAQIQRDVAATRAIQQSRKTNQKDSAPG